MKESIGTITPETEADTDHDSVADAAEHEFEDISRIQPAADNAPARVPSAKRKNADGQDDLLESARRSSSSTAPGWSN